jgi:hypothetical protein
MLRAMEVGMSVPTFAMRWPRSPLTKVCLFLVCSTFLESAPSTFAGDDIEGVEAVASKLSDDYVRARMPDGSFLPESYLFGEGGKWAAEFNDATIDKLHFLDVAKVIALPQSSRKYLPSKDPARTKLLIMMYWDTAAVPGPTSDSTAYTQFGPAPLRARAIEGPRRPRRDRGTDPHTVFVRVEEMTGAKGFAC